MENFLIDHDVLGVFIDGLLAKDPSRQAEREQYIKELDDRISQKIFGSLSQEQLKEFNQVLDLNYESAIQEFFAKNNIDLQDQIKSVMDDFAKEFLGGDHA